MKKIIVGYIIDGRHSGIDKYLLQFLDTIKENKNVEIHFLTNKVDTELEKKICNNRIKLIEIPKLRHLKNQYNIIKNIIKENNYDIAYFNISEAFNCLGLKAAFDCNVKKIIVHSHSSGSDKKNIIVRNIYKILHIICKRKILKYANEYLACSKNAAIWMYNKKNIDKVRILYNPIDFKKFYYNEKIRDKIRKELNINKDEIILGHVGNFSYQKNHNFLIDIFYEFLKINNNAKLLLVGKGRNYNTILKKVERKNIKDKVLFLGVIDNVNEVMQAMDIFVLPSNFEGLPIVGTEAQVANLECFVADNITRELKISNKIHFVSLKRTAKYWAELITKEYKSDNRKNNNLDIEKANKFTKEMQVEIMQEIIK